MSKKLVRIWPASVKLTSKLKAAVDVVADAGVTLLAVDEEGKSVPAKGGKRK